MTKVESLHDQNSDSDDDSQKQIEEKIIEHIDKRQIQKFQQALDRLKKFVEQSKSVKDKEDDEFKRYNDKFFKLEKSILRSWQDVVRLVQERIERIIKNQKILSNWSKYDRMVLHWVVIQYAKMRNIRNIEKQFAKQDWEFVASLIPGTVSDACMFKWLSFNKTNLYEANWSQQQSTLLKNLVSKYVEASKSIRWKDVCKKLYLHNQNAGRNYRTPKQCKQHYHFKLNPNLRRQPWTQQQDILLLKTVKQNSGLKKWVDMVKLFCGRTQNAVKNRYNLIIEKQKKCLTKQKDELELVDTYLQRCYIEKFTQIIEPDSQQCRQNVNRVQKKKRRRRRNNWNEQKKISEDRIENNMQIENIKIQQKETEKPLMKVQISEYKKIEKREKIQEQTSVQQKCEIDFHGQEFMSMQNLPQINNYDHRANDIQFNFMNMEEV